MEKSFHVLISRPASFFFFDISLRGILCGGVRGSGRQGEKGAGDVREAREEGAGSGRKR